MKHIKIKALQEIFDAISQKQVEELKKTPEEYQTGFLWGLLFCKTLIVNKEIEIMNSEEK